jgi:hypothetical protein
MVRLDRALAKTAGPRPYRHAVRITAQKNNELGVAPNKDRRAYVKIHAKKTSSAART